MSPTKPDCRMFSSTLGRGLLPNYKLEGDEKHDEFISRIEKTLYYGEFPQSPRFSLPVSELASELYTEVKRAHSIKGLDMGEAAAFSKKASVSPCSLVLALLYLERLKVRDPEYLRRVDPSELFVISLMVASKFLHDDGEDGEVFNDDWASSAGIEVQEINRSERDFLDAIGWKVFVSNQQFWKSLNRLEKDVALQEGKKRGWYSYTDLDLLMGHVDLIRLAHTVLSVTAVCLTGYTISVLTLLGSVLIVSHIPGTTLNPSSIKPMDKMPLNSHPPVLNHLPLVAFHSTNVILNAIHSLNEIKNCSVGVGVVNYVHHSPEAFTGGILQSESDTKCKDNFERKSTCNNYNKFPEVRLSSNLSRNGSVEVPYSILVTNR